MESSQNYGQSWGTMHTVAGTLAYIKDDIGTDVLVVPEQCSGYGGVLPPIGSRVAYDIVVDAVGTMKAERVQPEHVAQAALLALAACQPQLQQPAAPLNNMNSLALANMNSLALAVPQPIAKVGSVSGDRQSGVFQTERGSYGFIKQDSGEGDLFVMPRECTGFGGAFPTLGTRVVFELAHNSKTGKPKAQNVRPGFSGTMAKAKGSFGFITQDSGEGDIFTMPRQCAYFGEDFPPIGTRVVFEMGMNTKTGKPCAEHVQPMYKSSGSASVPQLLCAGAVAAQQPMSTMPGLGQATPLLALGNDTAQDQADVASKADSWSTWGFADVASKADVNSRAHIGPASATESTQEGAKRRRVLEA